MSCYLCLTELKTRDTRRSVVTVEHRKEGGVTKVITERPSKLKAIQIAELTGVAVDQDMSEAVESCTQIDGEVLNCDNDPLALDSICKRIAASVIKRNDTAIVVHGLPPSQKSMVFGKLMKRSLYYLIPHIDISSRVSSAANSILSPSVSLRVLPRFAKVEKSPSPPESPTTVFPMLPHPPVGVRRSSEVAPTTSRRSVVLTDPPVASEGVSEGAIRRFSKRFSIRKKSITGSSFHSTENSIAGDHGSPFSSNSDTSSEEVKTKPVLPKKVSSVRRKSSHVIPSGRKLQMEMAVKKKRESLIKKNSVKEQLGAPTRKRILMTPPPLSLFHETDDGPEQLIQTEETPSDTLNNSITINNGLCEKTKTVLSFSNSTFIRMPPIENMSKFIESFRVDFWMSTTTTTKIMEVLDIQDETEGNCSLNITLNATKSDTISQSSIRIRLKDAANIELYVEKNIPHMCDGNWHLVEVHINSARSRDVKIFFDGRNVNETGSQPELVRKFTQNRDYLEEYEIGPSSFNSWNPCIFVGGNTNCKLGGELQDLPCLNPFVGSLCEMRFWDLARTPRVLLSKYPLNDRSNELTDLITGLKAQAVRTSWIDARLPTTFVRFDGVSFINVTPMGEFGSKMHFFSIEMWIKTETTSRPMSLLKTTDSVTGQCVGLSLHSTEEGSYSLNTIKAEVVTETDMKTTAVTSKSNLCNGEWHHLYWAHHYGDMIIVCDGEDLSKPHFSSPPLETPVNSRNQNLRQGRPRESDFSKFTSNLTIGAHNNGGKIEHCFDGVIAGVEIQINKTPYARWPMTDGVGSLLVRDEVGTNHGTHQLHTKIKQRNWMCWYPLVPHESSSAAVEGLIQTLEWKHVEMHANNAVRVACLDINFKNEASIGAAPVATVTDILHDREIDDLETTDATKLPQGTWSRPLCGSEDLIKFLDGCIIKFGLSETEAPKKKEGEDFGTIIILLSVGDAILSVCLTAEHRIPNNSTFDIHTRQWHGPITSFRKRYKSTMYKNKSNYEIESALLSIGSRQHIHQSVHRNGAGGVVRDDVVASLLLPHWRKCLNNVHVFHCLAKTSLDTVNLQDSQHALCFLGGMTLRTRNLAAIKIQTQIRRVLALAKVRLRRSKEHPRSPLATNPFPMLSHSRISMSGKRTALLVASYMPIDDQFEPPLEVSYHMFELSETLESLGYSVKTLHSKSTNFRPTRASTLSAISEFLANDADADFSIIWIGGRGNFGKGLIPPSRGSQIRSWVVDDEKVAREILIEEEDQTSLSLMAESLTINVLLPKPTPNVEVREKQRKHFIRIAPKRRSTDCVSPVHSPTNGNTTLDLPSEDCMLASRINLRENEWRCRHRELESKTRMRLMVRFDEDIEWSARYPSLSGAYVLLDDTPIVGQTSSETLVVDDVMTEVQSIQSDVPRLIIFDTIGWRSEPGFYHIALSSAMAPSASLHVGNYTGRNSMMASLYLNKALKGRAAKEQREGRRLSNPCTLMATHVDGKSCLNVDMITSYVLRRLTKRDEINATCNSGPARRKSIASTISIAEPPTPTTDSLVSDDFDRCSAVLQTFWLLVTMPAGEPQRLSTLSDSIKQSAELQGVPVTVLPPIPLPFVDIDIAIPYGTLSRNTSVITEIINKSLKNFDTTVVIRPGDYPNIVHSVEIDCGGRVRSSRGISLSIPQRKKNIIIEVSIIRITLTNSYGERDLRWTPVESASNVKEINDFLKSASHFAKKTLIPQLSLRLRSPLPVGRCQQFSLIRGCTNSIGTSRIIKVQHRDELRSHPNVSVVAGGAYLGDEGDRFKAQFPRMFSRQSLPGL